MNRSKLVKIVFDSFFMKNDSLVFENVTLYEAREAYFKWWKRYNKNKKYAMKKLKRIKEIV